MAPACILLCISNHQTQRNAVQIVVKPHCLESKRKSVYVHYRINILNIFDLCRTCEYGGPREVWAEGRIRLAVALPSFCVFSHSLSQLTETQDLGNRYKLKDTCLLRNNLPLLLIWFVISTSSLTGSNGQAAGWEQVKIVICHQTNIICKKSPNLSKQQKWQ